jgi:hypothetical protein
MSWRERKTFFAMQRTDIRLGPMHGMRCRLGLSASFVALAICGTASYAQNRLDPPPPRPDGVTPAVEKTIEKGFKYLASIREKNGQQCFWGARPGEAEMGLAFLAHGDTPTRGEYADVVDGITEYLLSTAGSSGLFSSGDENEPGSRKGPRPMYGHAFAMTFLAQVYGQEADAARRDRIRDALKKGVELTKRSQSEDGGWGYQPNYFEDEGTLTVTQLQSLRSCRDSGILVSKSVIDKGVRYLEESSDENGQVRYRVRSDEYRPGCTCAAVVALWNAGQYDSPRLKKIQDWVNRYIQHQWDNSSRRAEHPEYVEYYLAQAKWIMGGQIWADFYKVASADFVRIQDQDGHWDSSDERHYGTTYATAIALIVLQLPYNRLPVYQR